MIRLAVAVTLLVMIAPAALSQEISLDQARSALARAAGIAFAVGPNHYIIRSAHVVDRRGRNKFRLDVEVAPLPKMEVRQ